MSKTIHVIPKNPQLAPEGWEDFNKLPRNKVISYYNSVAIMNSTFDFRPIGEIIISSV